LTLSDADRERLRSQLIHFGPTLRYREPLEGVALGDFADWAGRILPASIDLLFLDPPYNLTKAFDGLVFSKRDEAEYTSWFRTVLSRIVPCLKPTATIYICGDWRTSHSLFEAASERFVVRNRITWEREKGRGAKTNWKNASEDIWFCTVSDDYHFDVEAVKMRRRVIAPYTQPDGSPKDWDRTEAGDFRDTHPSNLWTDISIPFWSMSENTDHPTQKSEKLLAKLMLASTKVGDLVFDPFLGSGTTSVVAKKLGRRCFGVEISEEFCLWSLRRLELAETGRAIQGYADGVFWERNTLAQQLQSESSVGPNGKRKRRSNGVASLFD
jgi:site-specific DNA-methyltransferase (adenine-specific)